jgi:hypothetical protein
MNAMDVTGTGFATIQDQGRFVKVNYQTTRFFRFSLRASKSGSTHARCPVLQAQKTTQIPIVTPFSAATRHSV